MPSINTGKVSLFYDDVGSGHPVVLVHGIPTDYRAWDSQKEALLSRNFRMLPISRRLAYPNKNSSSDLNQSTVQNNAEDIIELIQKLKLEGVHLVGHSFGGFVSLYSAWKHPEFFRSLVLVEPAVPSMLVENESNPLQVLWFLLTNPSAALSGRRFQRGKLKLCLSACQTGDLQNAVRYFYDGIREEEGGFEKLPENIRSMMSQNALTVCELSLEFPLFTKKDAPEIRMPVLLVKGQNSPQWLRAIVDSLGKSVPNSSVVEIADSGHLPHIEAPSAFNEALLKFLERYNKRN